MSAAIEIRKTDDGAVLARRLDGKPLTAEDREEAKRVAATRPAPADDPLLSLDQWYPEFHRLHVEVIAEASDFDYGWLRRNRPDLYRRIKDKENEIDGLEAARLSEVMAIMADWRRLVIQAEFEGQQDPAPVAATRPPHLTAQELIDIDNGKILAVLMDSDFGPLWFAFNDDFRPGDDTPVFFASELPFLRQMTPDELRRRYIEKRALGGGWIRDRTDVPTKH